MLNQTKHSFKGDDVTLHEWPIGLEICDERGGVLIRSMEDAEMVIESLQRYIEIVTERLILAEEVER